MQGYLKTNFQSQYSKPYSYLLLSIPHQASHSCSLDGKDSLMTCRYLSIRINIFSSGFHFFLLFLVNLSSFSSSHKYLLEVFISPYGTLSDVSFRYSSQYSRINTLNFTLEVFISYSRNNSHVAAASVVFIVYPVGQGDCFYFSSFILYLSVLTYTYLYSI